MFTDKKHFDVSRKKKKVSCYQEAPFVALKRSDFCPLMSSNSDIDDSHSDNQTSENESFANLLYCIIYLFLIQRPLVS